MTSGSGVRLAVRELLIGSRWLVLAAAILPVLTTIVLLGLEAASRLGRDRAARLEVSVWEFAGNPARWLMFATGIVAATAIVPILVAHGITRRAAALAGLAITTALATAAGLYLALGFRVESAAYELAGATQHLTSAHLFNAPTQWSLVITEYAVLFAGYLAAGWLAGTVYYRTGARMGTLLLPLTVALPLITVEATLTSRLWFYGGGFLLLPAAPAVGLALAAVAVTLLAAGALTRRMPVRSR